MGNIYEDEATNGDLVFICVDESQHATRAFDWFHEHHYRGDHTIGIVHIEVDPEKHREHKQNGVEEPGNKHYEVMKKSAAILQKYLQKCSYYGMKVKVFSKIKTGTIGQTICELIQENNPSMIVVGQRGINAFQRTLFGSVSEHLLHHAHIPMLIIPPPKERTK